MRRLVVALVGLASAVLVAGAAGRAADTFTGTWTVHPQPGTPWASGSSLTIAASTESAVRAIAGGADFQSHCGGSYNLGWYTVKYAWSGGKTLGGCNYGTPTQQSLVAYDNSGAVNMNLNPLNGNLYGYWTNTGQLNVDNKITATKDADASPSGEGAKVAYKLRATFTEPGAKGELFFNGSGSFRLTKVPDSHTTASGYAQHGTALLRVTVPSGRVTSYDLTVSRIQFERDGLISTYTIVYKVTRSKYACLAVGEYLHVTASDNGGLHDVVKIEEFCGLDPRDFSSRKATISTQLTR